MLDLFSNLFSIKVAYGASSTLNELINNISSNIITPIIQILIAVAVAVFLYGLVEFLMSQANNEKKSDGKQHMLWGIVGLTIMIGAEAIIGWIS